MNTELQVRNISYVRVYSSYLISLYIILKIFILYKVFCRNVDQNALGILSAFLNSRRKVYFKINNLSFYIKS